MTFIYTSLPLCLDESFYLRIIAYLGIISTGVYTAYRLIFVILQQLVQMCRFLHRFISFIPFQYFEQGKAYGKDIDVGWYTRIIGWC